MIVFVIFKIIIKMTLTILHIMIEIKHPVPADHRALGPGRAPEKKQIGENTLKKQRAKHLKYFELEIILVI